VGADAWVEVVAVFAGTIVDVQHVGRAGWRDYTIGEGPRAAFPVACGASAVPLVRADGQWVLRFAAGTAGDVEISGRRVALAALIADGRARADDGVYRWPLAAGGRCLVRHGAVTFWIRVVPRETIKVAYDGVQRPGLAYNAGAFAVLGGLLALTFLVPDTRALQLFDTADAEARFVGYLFKESLTPREEPRYAAELAGEDTVAGAPHAGPDGALGRPSAPRRATRVALKGSGMEIPRLARSFDPERAARAAGILGLMDGDGGLSAVGGLEPYGDASASVWGGLTGAEIGERYGVGGLGLVGTGGGGALHGEGVIGLANAGLIGKGGCGRGTCNGSSYGRGAGVGLGERTTNQPRVHQARAKVDGGLDEAVVRRVVRTHLNEIRHCYDQALTRDPTTEGRLTLEFLVGDAGQVSNAVVGESEVRDELLGRCVVQAARRWRFPRAAGGGGTLVTYPFTFEPV